MREFKEGDEVIVVMAGEYSHLLTNGEILKVIGPGAYDDSVTLARNGVGIGGFNEKRFELSKNYIVRSILKDL